MQTSHSAVRRCMMTEKRVFVTNNVLNAFGDLLFPIRNVMCTDNAAFGHQTHINRHNCLLTSPKPMYDRIKMKCTRCFIIERVDQPAVVIRLSSFCWQCESLLGRVEKCGSSAAYDMMNTLSSKRMVLRSLLLAHDHLNKHFRNRFHFNIVYFSLSLDIMPLCLYSVMPFLNGKHEYNNIDNQLDATVMVY